MRKKLFILYNFLTGKQVLHYKKEIARVNYHNTSELTINYQEQRFKKLLSHAIKTCSFYSDYKSLSDISTLPVIDKNIINNRKKEFISNKFELNKLKKISTSGSTGVPFVVYHDSQKVNRQLADNFYFSEICGHIIGEKIYYIRIWNEINKLSKLQKLTKNIVPIDTSSIDNKNVKNLIKSLSKSKSTKSILAYSSSLEVIMSIITRDNIEKRPIRSLKCIFTMAEALSEQTKLQLSEYFQTKVFSRYSNSENGFLAHQLPFTGNSYLINKASFIIEVLHLGSDKPVENGERGRIVITDLYNFGMPMIRYDTGDIGVINEITDKHGKKHEVLVRIEGRMLDFIFTEGKFISPHTIDYALRTVSELKQFQLIQKKDNSFMLLLNTSKDLNEIEIKKIIDKLKFYIGYESIVKIKFVDDIPLLASGKRKIVIVEN